MQNIILKKKYVLGVACAVSAAVLYALNVPVSKILLAGLPPVMLAGLLYLGAGLGLGVVGLSRKLLGRGSAEQKLGKKDLPYVIGMVVLDILAPILLLYGLSMTSAAHVSLLNNFEIAATSIIAFFIFKEAIAKKTWIAILFVIAASLILSVEDISAFSFSAGSLLVLGACVCWGFENNCTRMISGKSPLEIVVIKGLFSGTGSLILSAAAGERLTSFSLLLPALGLGFVAYGLSIYCYIYAQRQLGAAETSIYYALAPVIGAVVSLFLFREKPTAVFLLAFVCVAMGICFTTAAARERMK